MKLISPAVFAIYAALASLLALGVIERAHAGSPSGGHNEVKVINADTDPVPVKTTPAAGAVQKVEIVAHPATPTAVTKLDAFEVSGTLTVTTAGTYAIAANAGAAPNCECYQVRGFRLGYQSGGLSPTGLAASLCQTTTATDVPWNCFSITNEATQTPQSARYDTDLRFCPDTEGSFPFYGTEFGASGTVRYEFWGDCLAKDD